MLTNDGVSFEQPGPDHSGHIPSAILSLGSTLWSNIPFYCFTFRCLSNLQYLGAGENNLTSIPTEIGKLL